VETSSDDREIQLLNKIEQLQHEIVRLHRDNEDLEIALQTTIEHGDLIEAELHESNQRLQAEVSERKLAQSTLQEILETVAKDKKDLEIILAATAAHGDLLEYQLYTQAVETMRQSEELFRAISESTPILMILTQRLDGEISFANSTSGVQLGIGKKELLGHKLKEFFVDPFEEGVLGEKLRRDGEVRNHEMLIRRVDGSSFWVSASIHPLSLGGEHTLLTTLYDISDRRRAEEALRLSQEQLRQQAQELEQRVEQRTAELQLAEEKYRSIFENAIAGIYQVTPQGQYLSANPALAQLLGYDSPVELMATVTDVGPQLYAQPLRREELMAYMRRYNSVSECESEVYRKDGTLIWISENIRAIYSREGDLLHYEGSVQDITARRRAEEELRHQRQTAERLLLNILPQPIAERLKRNPQTIADSFDEVTVLFADIAGFTHLSARSSPIELVSLLNQVFSAFDQLADKYDLEKIKTIGDAYMVVGGLPKPRPDHLDAIARMALDLQQEIVHFKTKDNVPISLRIGIHTGPVVAGVIGAKKFIYDLWGDTVNVASRMESQGETGRIQVTETVFNRLKHRYLFERRGLIEVKGKGEMLTYWLVGRAIHNLPPNS
jgi:PAS domain S-box-containing protein